MGWQYSSAGLSAGSQAAPLVGPDGASTSSASNIGNQRDATGPRCRVGRSQVHRGIAEIDGRPNLGPFCREPKMAPGQVCPVAGRRSAVATPRSRLPVLPAVETDRRQPKNHSAEIPHPTQDCPIPRQSPTGSNLRQRHEARRMRRISRSCRSCCKPTHSSPTALPTASLGALLSLARPPIAGVCIPQQRWCLQP
jgi:hypothetical protein